MAHQQDVEFFVEYYSKDHNGKEILDSFINQLGKDSDADDGEEMITGLIMASEYEHIDIVKYLLNNGASINRTDDYGNTAIHYAAQFNQKDTGLMKLLLDHPSVTDSILNKQNNGGYTALDYAYANETKLKFDMIKIMSSRHGKRGLQIDREEKDCAEEQDFTDDIKDADLLNALNDLKRMSVKEFQRELKRDAKEKNPNIKTRLELQTELNESRQLGPFIYAAKEEDVRALKDLLYSGASISQTTSDTKKWNALHFAAKFNKRNTDTIKFLLNHPDILDSEVVNKQSEDEGLTPLDIAYMFNNSIIRHDIIRTLTKKGCLRKNEVKSSPEV